MTVGELIARLQKMPQDAKVCVRDRESDTETHYGYDEAKDVTEVFPPESSENYWDKSAVMII